MDRLPMEVISHIISFLDLCDQLPLSSVSVRWRAAVSDCLRRRRRLDWQHLHRRWPSRIQVRLTDAQLRVLLPRLPALRELDLTNHRGVQFDIDIVSETCPHLEKLNLSAFRLDTDSLERLCRRCPRLWDVGMPRDCESDLLELLLHRLPGLRALGLESTDVSKTSEMLFPDDLERLALNGCHLTGSLWLKPDRWPRLTELVLTQAGGPADGLAALVRGCPRLQSLVAWWSDADDTLLRVLPALPLRHLDISGCEKMTEHGLVSCFGRLRQLESLDISYLDGVTDRVLDTLAGAESLRELTVGEFTGDIVHIPTEVTMEALRRLVVTSPSLMMLKFNFDDEWMDQQEPSIRSLQLLLENKKQGAIP